MAEQNRTTTLTASSVTLRLGPLGELAAGEAELASGAHGGRQERVQRAGGAQAVDATRPGALAPVPGLHVVVARVLPAGADVRLLVDGPAAGHVPLERQQARLGGDQRQRGGPEEARRHREADEVVLVAPLQDLELQLTREPGEQRPRELGRRQRCAGYSEVHLAAPGHFGLLVVVCWHRSWLGGMVLVVTSILFPVLGIMLFCLPGEVGWWVGALVAWRHSRQT